MTQVIIIESVLGYQSLNPEQGCTYFLPLEANYSLSTYERIVIGHTDLLNLDMATNPRERKL